MLAETFRLDRDQLLALADERAASFREAQPFQHVVIDDFLPADVIRELVENFPTPEADVWYRFNAERQVKLALNDETLIPLPLNSILRELNGQVFVEFLERISGIDGLVPDPHYRGGGLHQIQRGGLLKVHADFDMHDRLSLTRRLNAILYLNTDWDESYGGALELWNRQMTEAVHKVYPIVNRLVIFRTDDHSNHGHPDPLNTPEGMTRKSMAWYYYTSPKQVKDQGHSTLFRERPGENFEGLSLRQVIGRKAPKSIKKLTKRGK